MSRIFAEYVNRAQGILDANWVGASTRPAPALYPHQWNWVSVSIAIGRSQYDTAQEFLRERRATAELEYIFYDWNLNS